jgi:predicted DNA-binding protein
MRNKSKESHRVVMSLRIPADMQKRIRPLAKNTQLSDDDIVRLAIERGLSLLGFQEVGREPGSGV